MDNKIEKLKSILELLKNDTITPKQLKDFLVAVLTAVKNVKGELENASKEDMKTLKEALAYIKKEKGDILSKVSAENNSAKMDLAKKMKEVDRAVEEIRKYRPENGIDGIDGKDGKDGSPDNRLQIVEKINSGKKNDIRINIEQIAEIEKLATVDNLNRAISILDQRTQFLINKQTTSTGSSGGISLTDLSASAPLSYNSGTGAFSIAKATTLADGYLSKEDWATFNGKQTASAILSTLGALANGAGVLTNDGAGNLSWAAVGGTGTVTSVSMTVPTGLSISGSPITTFGTLALTLTSGYVIPTTTEESNWNTAYGWGNHAGLYLKLDQSTPQTFSGTGFTGNGLLKITSGTIGVDTSTYLTANQSISLSGAVTGSGTTSISTTLAENIAGAGNLKGATSTKLANGSSGNLLKSLGDGTFGWDTNTYLTSLSGAVLTDQSTPQTIGATGARLAKLWATDITVTNAITGSVTGNAGTVTNGVYTTSQVTVLAATAAGDKDKYLHSNASTGALEWTTVSGGTGITWSAVTSDGNLSVDTGTLANKGTLLTLTLPSTCAVGKVIRVAGINAGLWKIAQNASQYIKFGNKATTTGTGGYLASTLAYDAVELVCIEADLGFTAVSSIGNITIA